MATISDRARLTLRARGKALFDAACARDLEVGKWAKGRYETDGVSTSWLKIKNPAYPQIVGRRELFETRQDRRRSRAGIRPPVLWLAVSGRTALSGV